MEPVTADPAEDELRPEGAPTDDQMNRLEDLLTELFHLTRKYQILLHDPDDGLRFVDLPNGTTVGIGLTYHTKIHTQTGIKGLLVGYHATDSILDGAWPVDGPQGPVEQRTIRPPFPRRDSAPD